MATTLTIPMQSTIVDAHSATLCENYMTAEMVADMIQRALQGCNESKEENENKDGMNMFVSKETKTVLHTKDSGMLMLTVPLPNDKAYCYNLIPDIKNVRVYKDDNDNPRAVYLDFADGTSTSAVLQNDDNYDIDHAFSVCITKRLLDSVTNGNGHQAYNKLVRRARRVYENGLKEAERLEKEAAAQKAREEKLAEKKRKREKRRAEEYLEEKEKAREELIEIEKEAFLRALREYRMTVDDLK